MANILIVDDEKGIRSTLSGILTDEGHETVLCESGEEALTAFSREAFDLMLLDVWLPGIDGLAVLERVHAADPVIPVIVISGHGTVDTAVRATKLGAYDFLEKPLSLDRVILTVNHALSDRRLRQEVSDLRRTLAADEVPIGESDPMVKLMQRVKSAAASNTRVLISGENGSGKEIIARSLHRLSPRAERPFIDVNCAAIPEELIESELFGHRKGAFTGAIEDRKGKFELADGGTLFLDEVGDMSLKTQAKVLRVLQEQQFQRVGAQKTITVDVRVIAATNKNLEEEIREDRFREDLYFRLNVIPLAVPPLRDRGDDIVLLARHFLRQFAADTGRRPKVLLPEAITALRSYSWPGNVRELRNLAERLTILIPTEEISASDLDLAPAGDEHALFHNELTLRDAREEFERRLIVRRLRENGGNVSRTADSLGVERSNLYRKLNAYGIRADRERS